MSFEKKLNKYADLIVCSGLNVQKGQIVVINGSIESYQLIRAVGKKAYEVGAKEVVVQYHDNVMTRLKYENMDEELFNHVPAWLAAFKNDYAKEHACFLYIEDSDPEMLVGIKAEKLANWQKSCHQAFQDYYDLSDNMTNSWCIVGGCGQKWANKVFPDMSDQEAKIALWNAIFKAAKIDETNDPCVIWQKHKESFEKRVRYLNELHLTSLSYKNSLGTDIKIGLNPGYLFAGGGSYLSNGLYTFPNIPTEEIFTSPDYKTADGIVMSSLPLNYGGSLVEDFYLRFRDGQVIDFGAKKGYEILKGIIETDEGSRRLGEIALIPYDSPINNMKTLFYNTLFDENASCHFALGKGFSECIENGIGMTKEQLLEKGVNDSLTHVDFMIGTSDLSIVGTCENGQEVVIFKDGNFVF